MKKNLSQSGGRTTSVNFQELLMLLSILLEYFYIAYLTTQTVVTPTKEESKATWDQLFKESLA